MSKNIMKIRGIDCYEESGIAYLKLESVARGLGFTETATSGNECVRWRTVRSHLESLGIATSCDGTMLPEFITENVFYRLAMKAKNEVAEKFQALVADEILPSIRRHGGYLTPEKVEEALTDPDTIIRLATNLKEERAKRKELEALREAERPKVLFADSVSASETDILVGDLAKILKQNGIDIGQNRLFEFLRREGYLCRKQGDMWNMPTQTAMNTGLFKIMETTFIRNGKTFVTKTVKVTGRGQVYFVNLFLRRAKEETEKAAAAQLQLAQN